MTDQTIQISEVERRLYGENFEKIFEGDTDGKKFEQNILNKFNWFGYENKAVYFLVDDKPDEYDDGTAEDKNVKFFKNETDGAYIRVKIIENENEKFAELNFCYYYGSDKCNDAIGQYSFIFSLENESRIVHKYIDETGITEEYEIGFIKKYDSGEQGLEIDKKNLIDYFFYVFTIFVEKNDTTSTENKDGIRDRIRKLYKSITKLPDKMPWYLKDGIKIGAAVAASSYAPFLVGAVAATGVLLGGQKFKSNVMGDSKSESENVKPFVNSSATTTGPPLRGASETERQLALPSSTDDSTTTPSSVEVETPQPSVPPSTPPPTTTTAASAAAPTVTAAPAATTPSTTGGRLKRVFNSVYNGTNRVLNFVYNGKDYLWDIGGTLFEVAVDGTKTALREGTQEFEKLQKVANEEKAKKSAADAAAATAAAAAAPPKPTPQEPFEVFFRNPSPVEEVLDYVKYIEGVQNNKLDIDNRPFIKRGGAGDFLSPITVNDFTTDISIGGVEGFGRCLESVRYYSLIAGSGKIPNYISQQIKLEQQWGIANARRDEKLRALWFSGKTLFGGFLTGFNQTIRKYADFQNKYVTGTSAQRERLRQENPTAFLDDNRVNIIYLENIPTIEDIVYPGASSSALLTEFPKVTKDTAENPNNNQIVNYYKEILNESKFDLIDVKEGVDALPYSRDIPGMDKAFAKVRDSFKNKFNRYYNGGSEEGFTPDPTNIYLFSNESAWAQGVGLGIAIGCIEVISKTQLIIRPDNLSPSKGGKIFDYGFLAGTIAWLYFQTMTRSTFTKTVYSNLLIRARDLFFERTPGYFIIGFIRALRDTELSKMFSIVFTSNLSFVPVVSARAGDNLDYFNKNQGISETSGYYKSGTLNGGRVGSAQLNDEIDMNPDLKNDKNRLLQIAKTIYPTSYNTTLFEMRSRNYRVAFRNAVNQATDKNFRIRMANLSKLLRSSIVFGGSKSSLFKNKYERNAARASGTIDPFEDLNRPGGSGCSVVIFTKPLKADFAEATNEIRTYLGENQGESTFIEVAFGSPSGYRRVVEMVATINRLKEGETKNFPLTGSESGNESYLTLSEDSKIIFIFESLREAFSGIYSDFRNWIFRCMVTPGVVSKGKFLFVFIWNGGEDDAKSINRWVSRVTDRYCVRHLYTLHSQEALNKSKTLYANSTGSGSLATRTAAAQLARDGFASLGWHSYESNPRNSLLEAANGAVNKSAINSVVGFINRAGQFVQNAFSRTGEAPVVAESSPLALVPPSYKPDTKNVVAAFDSKNQAVVDLFARSHIQSAQIFPTRDPATETRTPEELEAILREDEEEQNRNREKYKIEYQNYEEFLAGIKNKLEAADSIEKLKSLDADISRLGITDNPFGGNTTRDVRDESVENLEAMKKSFYNIDNIKREISKIFNSSDEATYNPNTIVGALKTAIRHEAEQNTKIQNLTSIIEAAHRKRLGNPPDSRAMSAGEIRSFPNSSRTVSLLHHAPELAPLISGFRNSHYGTQLLMNQVTNPALYGAYVPGTCYQNFRLATQAVGPNIDREPTMDYRPTLSEYVMGPNSQRALRYSHLPGNRLAIPSAVLTGSGGGSAAASSYTDRLPEISHPLLLHNARTNKVFPGSRHVVAFSNPVLMTLASGMLTQMNIPHLSITANDSKEAQLETIRRFNNSPNESELFTNVFNRTQAAEMRAAIREAAEERRAMEVLRCRVAQDLRDGVLGACPSNMKVKSSEITLSLLKIGKNGEEDSGARLPTEVAREVVNPVNNLIPTTTTATPTPRTLADPNVRFSRETPNFLLVSDVPKARPMYISHLDYIGDNSYENRLTSMLMARENAYHTNPLVVTHHTTRSIGVAPRIFAGISPSYRPTITTDRTIGRVSESFVKHAIHNISTLRNIGVSSPPVASSDPLRQQRQTPTVLRYGTGSPSPPLPATTAALGILDQLDRGSSLRAQRVGDVATTSSGAPIYTVPGIIGTVKRYNESVYVTCEELRKRPLSYDLTPEEREKMKCLPDEGEDCCGPVRPPVTYRGIIERKTVCDNAGTFTDASSVTIEEPGLTTFKNQIISRAVPATKVVERKHTRVYDNLTNSDCPARARGLSFVVDDYDDVPTKLGYSFDPHALSVAEKVEIGNLNARRQKFFNSIDDYTTNIEKGLPVYFASQKQ